MKLNFLTRNMKKTAIAVLAAAALAAAQPAAAQVGGSSPERVELTFDVAEDMNLFIEPRVPLGTEPLRGSFFVTQGKIFPAGTIPASNGAMFDPNAISGSMGTWFCKGTFLAPGSVFDKTAMAVLSDQVYLFPNDTKSIATTGPEGNGLTVRAVIGGTGAFAGYTGEQSQQFLGFNKTGGVNLRVTIKLQKISNVR